MVKESCRYVLLSTVAIILARGGSKGIPKKNLYDFCGKPLLAWTIENCLRAGIKQVYVSSDSLEILDVAQQYGATKIHRPANLAEDSASSESGWLHALDEIEKLGKSVGWILGPQVTSPLREPADVESMLKLADEGCFDSILSVAEFEDIFIWKHNAAGIAESVTYDYKTRLRRQELGKSFVENGSLYLFRSDLLRREKNRLGGRIGMSVMEKYKMFQVDSVLDLEMCEVLMNAYGLANVSVR